MQTELRDGVLRAQWTVTEKQVRSSDKVAVSPPFAALGASFRLLLKPAAQHGHKGGQSFRASKGRCSVQLKCESLPHPGAVLPQVLFRVFVGALRRGPVGHNFTAASTAGLCGRTRAEELWDLAAAVRAGTCTLGVELWEDASTVNGIRVQ